MRRLAILGAGGHGRVVADCAAAAGWTDIAIFDDGRSALSGVLPWAIRGTSNDLLRQVDAFDGVIVAIGNNAARLDWHLKLAAAGARPVIIIHPRAIVSIYTVIGSGSVVVAGAIVNISSRLGQAVIVNTGATIDHDNDLADGVHVSPGAHLAGGVQVGSASWIGIGAVVREQVRIGSNVRIGAGAVVVKPVPDNVTMVGNPARMMGTL